MFFYFNTKICYILKFTERKLYFSNEFIYSESKRLSRKEGDELEYIVKTEHFEGPFDLLLELIKKHEMDIYDLSISKITKDYLDSIELLQKQDIEITSDFMEMASILLQIKSRMLLPAAEKGEDPRNELVQQILDYKEYKEAVEQMKVLKEMEQKFFKRQKVDIVHKKKVGTLMDVLNSYQGIFTKKFKTKYNPLDKLTEELTKFKYTMEDRIDHLKECLEVDTINVESYFSAVDDREEMIVTFGALLELVKSQYISIVIEDNGQILLEKRG